MARSLWNIWWFFAPRFGGTCPASSLLFYTYNILFNIHYIFGLQKRGRGCDESLWCWLHIWYFYWWPVLLLLLSRHTHTKCSSFCHHHLSHFTCQFVPLWEYGRSRNEGGGSIERGNWGGSGHCKKWQFCTLCVLCCEMSWPLILCMLWYFCRRKKHRHEKYRTGVAELSVADMLCVARYLVHG